MDVLLYICCRFLEQDFVRTPRECRFGTTAWGIETYQHIRTEKNPVLNELSGIFNKEGKQKETLVFDSISVFSLTSYVEFWSILLPIMFYMMDLTHSSVLLGFRKNHFLKTLRRLVTVFRSIHRMCSVNKVLLEISQNLLENTCPWVSFLIKAFNKNFIKKDTLAQEFSGELYKIFKNTLFTDHLRKTVSEYYCEGHYDLIFLKNFIVLGLFKIVAYVCFNYFSMPLKNIHHWK